MSSISVFVEPLYVCAYLQALYYCLITVCAWEFMEDNNILYLCSRLCDSVATFTDRMTFILTSCVLQSGRRSAKTWASPFLVE
jgi:hypothetical protein